MKRIESFNILRVLSAIGVLFYHLYWCFECRYGELDYIVSQSTYFMTTFFVLGGFVIGYSNYNKDFFSEGKVLISFFEKRFNALFPTYFLIYIFFMFVNTSSSTISEDFFSLPFQMTMTFGFEHYPHIINSGAWFFSLLFMCQLLGPYLLFITKRMTNNSISIVIVMIMIMLGCAPYLNVMVYASFVIRLMEFYIGICLACMYVMNGEKKFTNKTLGDVATAVMYLASLVGVFYLHKYLQSRGLNHSHFGGYNVLACSIIITMLAKCEGRIDRMINENTVIKTMSKYSMEIWCGTFFSAYYFGSIKNRLPVQIDNTLIGILSTMLFAVILAGYRNLLNYLETKYKETYKYVFGIVVVAAVLLAFLCKYVKNVQI